MSPKKLEITIFPIEGASLENKAHKVKDHVNLSGSGLEGGKFTPVQGLYIDDEGLVIACLKDGVTPNKAESKILLDKGIQAYSYELFKPAIQAAELGKRLEVVATLAKVPKALA